MTHKDIYTKFLIEYDKANVTSSYPLLTEYEVATILDKAYLSLIAQKVTGNNPRRIQFEGDIKAISDLEPLIVHEEVPIFNTNHIPCINMASFRLPIDYMYFILALVELTVPGKPGDDIKLRLLPVKLVDHRTAERFFATPYNMPWVKIPVCFIEGGICRVVYDPINPPNVTSRDVAHITYIRKPTAFTRSILTLRKYFLESDVYSPEDILFKSIDLNEILNENELYQNSNDTRGIEYSEVYGDDSKVIVNISEDYQEFELSDTMAEELISLAIVFALENVESQRLATKLNTRGLES